MENPNNPEEGKLTPIPALKTFKTDVAQTVQKDHISIVKMALAENKKREQSALNEEAASPISKKNLGWIGSSIILLLIAGGALGYFYWKSMQPANTVPTAPLQTDIIYFESAKTLSLQDLNKKNLAALINTEREVQLSLGSIEKIQIASSTQIPTSQFFAVLFTRIPQELLRSFNNGFFIGLHAFSTNEPFLIIPINNYDTAYAGMLAWEKNIKDDIGSFFIKPIPTPTPIETNASSTATTTEKVVLPDITPSVFQDKVIENKDTRVLMGADGKILFFYSFVDKQTLIFATNSNTLKELLIRINKPKLIH